MKKIDLEALAEKHRYRPATRCPVCRLPQEVQDLGRQLRDLPSRPSYPTVARVLTKEFGSKASAGSVRNHFEGHPNRESQS